MTAADRATFTPLTSGNGVSLMAAVPGADLADANYVEEELRATGWARSYGDHPPAAYATRVVVRRPETEGSGTLVVEWLNVSSGQDAAPDFTYLGAEIVRRGHTWAGVSAQRVGVEGGEPRVPTGITLQGLRTLDPARYGDLAHPGDAYAYDIYTQVARALAADLGASCVLAVGESQSAYALTSYLNLVHEQAGLFDGFLVHSRGGGALHTEEPTTIRPTDVPVLVVQTEGDLFGRLGFLPARQPDAEWFRLWEIAGAAHADRFQIGDFESFLGCAEPVNRGQQVYVVRAALRALESWARDGAAPPSAPLLAIAASGDDVERDDLGIALGGVRTPVVDAPADVPTGFPALGASPICELFGRTLPLPRPIWASHEDYQAAYERATHTAIAAGFVLPEDRDAVLAEARPGPLPG